MPVGTQTPDSFVAMMRRAIDDEIRRVVDDEVKVAVDAAVANISQQIRQRVATAGLAAIEMSHDYNLDCRILTVRIHLPERKS